MRSCGRRITVEKGLSQEVSRDHSRKIFFRRVEQFMVFRIPKLGIDNSQNVLIRKVWTYSKGKLKRDDLFIIEKREKETEYGTFRRNLRQRKS